LIDIGAAPLKLADFRERLASDGRADKLLDLILERLKAAGLVKERGRHRTDSTDLPAELLDRQPR